MVYYISSYVIWLLEYRQQRQSHLNPPCLSLKHDEFCSLKAGALSVVPVYVGVVGWGGRALRGGRAFCSLGLSAPECSP